MSQGEARQEPSGTGPSHHNAEFSAHQPHTLPGRGNMTRNIHMKAERACAHDACLPCWGLSERPSVAWLSWASLSTWLCTSPRPHLHQEHSSPTVLPPACRLSPVSQTPVASTL